MFYLKLLNRSAFRKKPLRTLILGVKLLFLIMFKLRSRFILKFGSASFKFEFKDEGKHKGGRGIFIFRENIEDLMLYGDQFIKHGDVCIDVGANQGLYTLAFSSIVGSSGTVMSIEPQTYAIDKINSFIHLNKFKKPIIINAALSNKEGEAVLDVTKGSGYASIVRDFGQKKTLKVNTITLDKIINDYDLTKLNFIKMDIEGAELNALKGSEFSLNLTRRDSDLSLPLTRRGSQLSLADSSRMESSYRGDQTGITADESVLMCVNVPCVDANDGYVFCDWFGLRVWSRLVR